MRTPPVDVDLVRALLGEQFPDWADEPVRPVELDGWDNCTFRVGDRLSARLPRGEGYSPQVAKEQSWLPVLAPLLPLPVPEPVALGRPGCGYPWPWSLRRWLPGRPAQLEPVDDPVLLARDLAGFLTALQAVDTAGGPAPGVHSWGRGGPLAPFDGQVRAAVSQLADVLDVGAVLAVWDTALERAHDASPVWVHGDVTASNLLVLDGRLAAVIDFGCCAVGDPACDLVVAWTLLTGGAREEFARRLSLPADAWARARGWALWKALLTAAEPDEAAVVHRYGWRCGALELVTDLVADHQLRSPGPSAARLVARPSEAGCLLSA